MTWTAPPCLGFYIRCLDKGNEIVIMVLPMPGLIIIRDLRFRQTSVWQVANLAFSAKYYVPRSEKKYNLSGRD